MAKDEVMSDFFYPKIQTVHALEPYRLRTTWSTGEALEVDVSKLMCGKAFVEIRKPEVFCTVHTDGSSIEWFDTELGPDNVYAWAKEQAGEVSHEMFGAWMLRNALSLSGAAQALGISRRMVSYYRTAAKAIPRAMWLACLGWEITLPNEKALPRGLPSAREYAALHA
jgi:Protein of unknown function (DUF2442)